METPERILRRLEFKVVRRLDGFLFGDYTGVFYGPSLDLAEVRQYQPGDEVRRIDWNVTARMNQLFVRQYREEKELTAWLLVDLSPSMDFGTVQQFKRQVAVDFAGVAAYIIARHGDKVGAIGFPTQTGELFVPPRTGRQQPLRIVHALAGEPPVSGGGRTDLGAVLQQLGRIVRRRSLLFLISDFHSPDGWDAALAELGKRHDVIAVRIEDPRERELPDVGGIYLEDPETGRQVWVDTSDRNVREVYRRLVETRDVRLAELMRRASVDMLRLSTGTSLVDPLLKFVTFRKRRRWNLPGQ
ncbi:MAG: DUF58 domain-containing protein [Bacillati bacterium ANGP1]|uniref:DUF58 domain-containing protein n=1 Tax=Candidatus Segetimicrobium genomatis TaxID=2569760 RepID=A0A537JIE5_9BACT|nr:MAG: DUF58 domain-containing protein [Terrabacteria group bacterium ANGP1]